MRVLRSLLCLLWLTPIAALALGEDELGQGALADAAFSIAGLAPEEAGLAREVDRDRHYLALALRQTLASPGEAVELLLHKVRVLLSPVEIANNIRLYELRDASPVLRATLGRAGLRAAMGRGAGRAEGVSAWRAQEVIPNLRSRNDRKSVAEMQVQR